MLAPVYQALKRLLVGRPLSSAESEHQRLSKTIALAVFSSDAISSTAYATEEILRVLVPLSGLAALNDRIPARPRALRHLTEQGKLMAGVTLFALRRAFSSGAAALTGVEAISNGVPAFRRPESKSAATTLMWMAIVLGGFFFGISVLAHRVAPTLQPEGHETILSILGRAV